MYSRCLLIIISLIKYSQATDECTGSGKVCGTAGQVCVDPTPEGSATQGDWWCQCVGQLKGAAIGRIANCGGGSVRVPAFFNKIKKKKIKFQNVIIIIIIIIIIFQKKDNHHHRCTHDVY